MCEKIKCFLCGRDAKIANPVSSRMIQITCPTCGNISYTFEFYNSYCHPPDYQLELFDKNGQRFNPKENEKAKTALRYYHKKSLLNGKVTEPLMTNNVQEIVNLYPIPANMSEKIDLVLDYIYEKTVTLFEKIEINAKNDYPLFFCNNEDELSNIFRSLSEEKLIEVTPLSILDVVDSNIPSYTHIVNLTYKGIKQLEDKQRHRINSKQCFVAMWFNDKEENGKPNMQKVYSEYIQPAIEETDAKFTSKKIDDVDHLNDINDQIITEIRRSRFVVVDLTGYRGGVYFEAGFAFGLGIPVIYTCNMDWLNSKFDEDGNLLREGVHFDLNHRNILFWTDNQEDPDYDKYNFEQFKKNLTARINAIIV